MEGWPIFILCAAGVQRREGHLTETLRSRRLPFRVLETVRGACPEGGRLDLHRRAWQRLCDEDLPGAILIEDGARLMPGFVEFLATGGYLHADLTQFCHGRARVWRWGERRATTGIVLRPLAASTGLASGYALTRRAAVRLIDAGLPDCRDARDSRYADWPCDIARMGALITRPNLVEAPDWLTEAEAAGVYALRPAEELPAAAAPRPAPAYGWDDLAAAVSATRAPAERLRGLALNGLSRALLPGA